MEGGSKGTCERCHIWFLEGKWSNLPVFQTGCEGNSDCWRWETHFQKFTPSMNLRVSKYSGLRLWVETWFQWPDMEFLDWIRSYSCAVHLCKSRWELAADSRSQCKESPQVTPSLYGAVLRKVLKAGSGPDAPPSVRLLRSSHSHTSSDTHTYTKATYTRLTMTDLSHFWLKKEARNLNAPLTVGTDTP